MLQECNETNKEGAYVFTATKIVFDESTAINSLSVGSITLLPYCICMINLSTFFSFQNSQWVALNPGTQTISFHFDQKSIDKKKKHSRIVAVIRGKDVRRIGAHL